MMYKGFLLLALFGWVSCGKEDGPAIDDSDLLIGYWMNPSGVGTVMNYDRTAALKKNTYGFGFKSGHVFVERKDEGWCGTAPVIMKDYQGTWARHDSVLDIEVAYWGGTAYYQWKIISLNRRSLKLDLIKAQYQQ